MNIHARTDKSFKNLASFAGEVLVECPHCKKRAIVFAQQAQDIIPHPTSFKAKFKCNNCYKPLAEKWWYGPINISPVNANCGYCGSKLISSKKVPKYQDKIEVKCSNCEQEKKYDVHYSLTYANNKQATDPYFGLQLWLQFPFDNNILWAYNFEHLKYVKNYVEAKLREAVSGGKYSLAWKLPNFIKVAKNRDKILKAIARLEKK
jgi:DNA-directed RNA polymerase subunit RPC12/RpoP